MQLKLSGNLKYVLQKLKTKKFPITVKCLTQYAHKNQTAEYKVNKTTKTSSSPIIWTLHGQYFHDTKKNLAERNRNSNNGVDLRQMTLNINAYLK